ncbi:hypothetical protein BVRB_3g069860 [Beta vulgaris subsp. vulgaris]|nr:hypothetical protein BVRB_3g069860 [Beta vulgaris subsp. vulgaris]
MFSLLCFGVAAVVRLVFRRLRAVVATLLLLVVQCCWWCSG